MNVTNFPAYDCKVIVYASRKDFDSGSHETCYYAAFGRIPCINERIFSSSMNRDSISGKVVDVAHYQFTDINLNVDTSIKAIISIVKS
ncbi:hypothetical protein NIES4101_74200 [Calothrix sp. NIES-4101]|nr:hypothetical protein NIES4101_74200 [Calothrix sp. NIES-4101]